MKKLLIKSISLVLILIMSALMMFSCDKEEPNQLPNPGIYNHKSIFPEGWTGGFRSQGGLFLEHWWVETYDEVVLAIEKLKSHGSTFTYHYNPGSSIFDYQGDMFDVKYCIVIDYGSPETEKIKFGDDPFDRKAESVYVITWCFFEDVTIDQINYSYVENYKGFEPVIYQQFIDNYTQDGYTIPPLWFTYEKTDDLITMYTNGGFNRILLARFCWHGSTNVDSAEEIIESLLTESRFYFVCDDVEDDVE